MYPQGATVEVYRQDIVLRFSRIGRPAKLDAPKRQGIRGAIQEYSGRSQKRLKLWLRNTEHLWKVFVTLTYPADYPLDGRRAKKHMHNFTTRLYRLRIRYTWVSEFQKRGALHFHMVLTKRIPYQELADMWDTIIGNDWQARGEQGSASTSIRAFRGLKDLCYLWNYVSKHAQKQLPDGFSNMGRWWGTSNGLLEKIVVKVLGKNYREIARKTRILRRWYKARRKYLGIRSKWRWNGMGFTAWDGRLLYDRLMGLRV